MARLLFVGGAVGIAVASALEDASALVQAHTAASVQAEMMGGRMAALQGAAAAMEQLPGLKPPKMRDVAMQLTSMMPKMPSEFNCTKRPWMCQEPFNCQLEVDPQKMALRQWQLAEDGHANLRTWCLSATAQYSDNLVKHCLADKDLKKSGQAVYEATRRGKFGPMTAEFDGSYCFIEGHCSNTAVTENTTLEEAEAMCDFRFGHDGWAKNFGFSDIMGSQKISLATMKGGVDYLNGGFYNTFITKQFLKAACAMGNYHCDVVYCKETYCKEEYYIKRFGHLLPKVPGHLIQERDWLE